MMNQENAIEISNVTKKFNISIDKAQTIKERIVFSKRRRVDRQVLRGISFNVKKGEAIGLIGHNGCGKSTTLKLLTRIMYPDSGSIEMWGRVSSLIELGAGFHPDMSGKENIYINASIFGLTRKEINNRVDDIIAFSQLEDFIDNPVRTYSSGMYMRLAFSVAINVDADILLIDEILAVGDISFQAKCFKKLREIKSAGATIVIVSHNSEQIEQICDRVLWLDGGQIKMEGPPNVVNRQYREYMEKKAGTYESPNSVEIEKAKGFSTKIEKVLIVNKIGKSINNIETGEQICIEIYYTAELDEISNPIIGLKFYREDGVVCYGTNTRREGIENIILREKGIIYCEIKSLMFLSGKYWLDVAIRNGDMSPLDYIEKACTFTVNSPIEEIGLLRLEHNWRMADAEE